MKRTILPNQFIAVVITLLLFIAGCGPEEEAHEYLSITNTEYVNGTDTDDGMIMRVYTYDLQTKALTKLSDLPYTSQYPLTVASLANETIYYSGAGKDKGDELYSYDIQAQTTQQLSSGLFAINSIIPDTVDHTLVMAAVKNGERPVKVIFFDQKTQEMNILNDDDLDTTTWDISFNPETSKTYAIQYSEEEQYSHMEESNKTQTPMVPPNHTIIEIDPISKQTRKVIELEEEQILTLSTRGDQILIATAKHINKNPIKYSMVNIKTGERNEIDLPIKARSGLFLSKDGQGFYFLGENTKANVNQERGIYFYDLKTQQVEAIFLQKEGFINNFILLSNP
ncbi:hypothetical protein [Paenibacillus taichungensis]|uniref:hypothetical protein n=1 Tax=Paenibacillus taichungensis TaxID=484184 RepID=UPI00287223D1|nr:hypothetical protein [Paenibacillus taichungensis]MDR9747449.1 hypothetical protein [Paenibacillus taichungensis]